MSSFLRYLITCCSIVISAVASSGENIDYFPEELIKGEKYLIYLHGKIIEDLGTRPTHPKFGVYEYEAILASFAAWGYTTISEVRKQNTDPQQYADHVSNQIRRYRAQGEAELNIVGFSKGAIITLLVSSQLDYADVKYAILAGCWPPSRNRACDCPVASFPFITFPIPLVASCPWPTSWARL